MERAEKLIFSRKLFNPNFFHIVKEMINPARRFIFPYGGSSSAKTYSLSQAIIILGCLIEGSDTIVFRKVSANIEKSIYKDFKGIIKVLGLDNYFVCQRLKIKCYNGSVVDFSGIDDPEKIKGISNYKRVVLEELSEFDFEDFKQVRKRLRGQSGQQIISAFNPIDVDHWIKVLVFDKQQKSILRNHLTDQDAQEIGFSSLIGESSDFTEVAEKWEGAPVEVDGEIYPPNFVVIKSTFRSNFWVNGSPCKTFGFYDIQTIADFERDKLEDFSFYNIYALGNWGKLNKGGEFYKGFNNEKHVKRLEYDPSRSLHLTFDENVNPFLTLDIHQVEGSTARQIDEICLPDPKNTLGDTLREFKTRYPNNGNTVFIYGDATSKKADVKLEKGRNFYTLIENQLKDWDYTILNRVPKSNPNVETRGNWLNKVFKDNIDGIEIFIGDNCINTIADYNYLKQASDGTKHKEKARHPITKVTYEKYGHNTDANDYFYTYLFEESFTKFRRPQGSNRGIISKRRVKKGY